MTKEHDDALKEVAELKQEVEEWKAAQMKKWDEREERIQKVEGDLQKLEVRLKIYEKLEGVFAELIENIIDKKGLTVGSNPTPGGTVNTTLTDIKHVVHVPVKENEVTIDTSTNRGKILRLAAKGFFKDWRKAKDVIDELERRGTAIHDKVVMMELAQLAKLGYLGRTTIEHQFAYKVPDEGVVFKE